MAEDTAEYVAFRLQRAGAERDLFSHESIAVLHEVTSGSLREIDRLASAACATPPAVSANSSTAMAIGVPASAASGLDGHRVEDAAALTRCPSSTWIAMPSAGGFGNTMGVAGAVLGASEMPSRVSAELPFATFLCSQAKRVDSAETSHSQEELYEAICLSRVRRCPRRFRHVDWLYR